MDKFLIIYLGLLPVLLGLQIQPVHADVTYVSARSSPFINSVTNYPHIKIYGKITPKDVQKTNNLVHIKSLFAQTKPKIPVFLDSRGGDLLATMKIGRILRKNNAWTIVGLGDQCSSACVFVLASGVRRDVFQGAKLGLHRPKFNPEHFAKLSASEAMLLYNKLINSCKSYFIDMGVSTQLLADMLAVESRKIDYKDRNYAKKVRLIGDDPGFYQWERAQDIKRNGKAQVHAMDELIDCYNSTTPHDICDDQYREKLENIDIK